MYNIHKIEKVDNRLNEIYFAINYGGLYSDYHIDWNHNDGIYSVYDSYINVIGGSYSNKELKLVRSYEDVANKKAAEATLTADISYVGGITGSSTFHMKMYVGNDRMISGMLGKINSVC